METEVLVTADVTEVIFDDLTELVLSEENTELTIEQEVELALSIEDIEVLALDAAPDWVWGTKITVSTAAPVNPRIGDVWIKS